MDVSALFACKKVRFSLELRPKCYIRTSELTVYRMLILFIVILERRLFSLLGVDMSDIYLTTCTVPQSNFPF